MAGHAKDLARTWRTKKKNVQYVERKHQETCAHKQSVNVQHTYFIVYIVWHTKEQHITNHAHKPQPWAPWRLNYITSPVQPPWDVPLEHPWDVVHREYLLSSLGEHWLTLQAHQLLSHLWLTDHWSQRAQTQPWPTWYSLLAVEQLIPQFLPPLCSKEIQYNLMQLDQKKHHICEQLLSNLYHGFLVSAYVKH